MGPRLRRQLRGTWLWARLGLCAGGLTALDLCGCLCPLRGWWPLGRQERCRMGDDGEPVLPSDSTNSAHFTHFTLYMRRSQFSKSLKRSIACSLQFSAQLCKEEFQKPSPSDFKNICSLWRDLRGLLGMAVPGYMEGHRRQKQVARRAHPKVQHVPGSAAAWPAFMDTCGANATSCSDASSTGSQTWLVPSY